MSTNNSPENLKKEEQEILTSLIRDMDNEMLILDKKLTRHLLEAQKAKRSCLPDAYGLLIDMNMLAKEEKIKIKYVQRAIDELYEDRLELEVVDDSGEKEKCELKVGLHTYSRHGKVFVCSWKMPVCRHYILEGSVDDFEGDVNYKGEICHTKYSLKKNRKIDMRFTKVKNVTHLFPLTSEEAERVIYDEFLKELADRRINAEFKNIVFSIQKKQSEIVKRPFRENIIVQGCAGSGKSMILLHRLPILLYDNPNSLDRNNLYVITPSLAYIQLVENMREQLEISDLKMGTVQQYYDHVIAKYGLKKDVYGKLNPSIHLSSKDEQYAYSEDLINEIKELLDKNITPGRIDLAEGLKKFNIEDVEKKETTPKERLNNLILKIQNILNQNRTWNA